MNQNQQQHPVEIMPVWGVGGRKIVRVRTFQTTALAVRLSVVAGKRVPLDSAVGVRNLLTPKTMKEGCSK